MRIFILTLALAASSLAFADTRSDMVWSCTLAASLRGNGVFYMREGRDSWEGQAKLHCTSGLQSQSKVVQITYRGRGVGFGVNENSVISVNADIITSYMPATFEIYAPVFNRDKPAIVWRNESAGILIEANVVSDDIPGIQASLQQGNLFIR